MSGVTLFMIRDSGINSDSRQQLFSRRVLRLIQIVILLSVGLVTGCSITNTKATITRLTSNDDKGIEIVLMPLDVELSILTAGGVLEPQAEWTANAKQYMLDAISGQYRDRGEKLLVYKPPGNGDPFAEKLLEIQRLHSVVGGAIVLHQLSGIAPLPTKKGKFEWTLGKDVSALRESYHADYALFIYVRDSYSSAGRVLAQVAAAALGVGIVGGQQVGFASLVDLNTGNIVWFNQLQSTSGDLRKPEPAAKTVANLLKGLPQ